MPEVTFYILRSESQQAREQFACKLIEKAYRNGQYSFVLTDAPPQSQRMDDALWAFRAGSFVPHEILQHKVPEIEQTCLIGHDEIPQPWQKLIVNLSSQAPVNFQQAERIIEVLDNSEQCKQQGRLRYKQYQLASLDITTHKI